MIPLRSYLSLLGSYLRPHRGRVATVIVVLVAALVAALAIPQLLERIVDGALNDPDAALTPFALGVVGTALVLQVLRVTATWLAEDLGWRATNALRQDLTDHVLHLDLSFHTSHSPGELIERVDGDVTALSNFFSAMIVHVGANAVLLAGIVLLMGRELLGVGVLAALLMGASAVASARLHGLVSRWWRDDRASSAAAAGQVGEIVDAAQDILANGARDHVQERYGDILREWLPRRIRAWSGWGVLWGASEVFQAALAIGVFVLGARALGAIDIAGIYVLVYYADMLREPLHQLREQLADLQKAGGAIDRVDALRRTTSSMRAAGETLLPDGPLSVSLREVGFTYPQQASVDASDDASSERTEVVLHDVDLELPAGRVLGLMGRTGSGKSTLARLVARLYDPVSGTVHLAGHDARDVADLRARVTMVSQDVQLFAATLRENLTLFADDIDDDRLVDALTTMGLRSWLDGLDDGLDTDLGPDGIGLSAGEAQLLALTRAFLRDPGVVILDEASSRMDPATEALLERAIDTLLDGRTAIIIAHRLHTLERADDVVVMEAGRIVEHGERRSLADDPTSRYAGLLATGLAEVPA